MAEKKQGFAEAMVLARAMFNVLEKSATNSFGGYDYSTLGDYLNAMEAALSANDFDYYWKPGLTEHAGHTGECLKLVILHIPSGTERDATAPIHYPKKFNKQTGEYVEQRDGIGYEIACTFAQKATLKLLTGINPAGEKTEEIIQPEVAEPEPPKMSMYEKAREAMSICKHSASMLKQKFDKAEHLTLKGEMTEEELVKLQEEFGSFLEEEVTA
jgi:hypothetical protein